MPAPPPYGVSSTVRCRSVVQRRRSWILRSRSPRSCALPGNESVSGARYSGKIDTTSMRTCSVLLERLEQPGPVGDQETAVPEVDLGHERRDERDQGVVTPLPAYDEQVLGRRVQDVRHGPHRCAVGGEHLEPQQLVVVELLGVVRSFLGG